jgi:hypothetical protein
MEVDGFYDDENEVLTAVAALKKQRKSFRVYRSWEPEGNWHAELTAALVAHVDSPAVCSVCSAPATCIGWCMDAGVAAMCDDHCGHGNEDSICYPVPSTRAEVERLQAIVDKLPKTADGVRVVPHVDIVWAIYNGRIGNRHWYRGDQNWVYGEFSHHTVRVDKCYSSREAAEAAKDGE